MLVRTYMVDWDTIGEERAPWQEQRGTICVFAQASNESVTGDAMRVSCSLHRSGDRGVWTWRFGLQMQVQRAGATTAYRAADLNARTWPDPLLNRTTASLTANAHLRAFRRFAREIMERASPSISEPSIATPSSSLPPPPPPPPPPRTENKLAAGREVTLLPNSATSSVAEFVAPDAGRIASPKVVRVFARILTAVAYAFASIATVEPTVNHHVAEAQKRDIYESPVPHQLGLLHRAFPMLPIRLLYRGSGQGRVYPSQNRDESKSWPSMDIHAMARVAKLVEGIPDVATVQLV
jgi:hypothetical protein